MTVYYVYGLIDPRNQMVRYVGCTYDMRLRLAQHLAANHKANPGIADWVLELRALGYQPEMRVLEEVTVETANPVEKEWIRRYEGQDEGLFNREPFFLGSELERRLKAAVAIHKRYAFVSAAVREKLDREGLE